MISDFSLIIYSHSFICLRYHLVRPSGAEQVDVHSLLEEYSALLMAVFGEYFKTYEHFQVTNASWTDELSWFFMTSCMFCSYSSKSESLCSYFSIELSNFTHECDCCFPPRDTRGYLQELMSRQFFPKSSGWIYLFLHIACWLFVGVVVCVRSVFSSTADRQRGANMLLNAPGCECGWFLNTKPKLFFPTRSHWKRISQNCLRCPAGTKQISDTGLKAKKRTCNYWRQRIFSKSPPLRHANSIK